MIHNYCMKIFMIIYFTIIKQQYTNYIMYYVCVAFSNFIYYYQSIFEFS